GPEAESVLAPLLEALRDKSSYAGAAAALGGIGKAAVPALTAALDDNHAGMRQGAAVALGKIGSDAKSAVRSLNYVYRKDPVPAVREAAGVALKKVQE